MDDETRRIIEDACRESDRLQAEFERDEQRRQRAKWSQQQWRQASELVYKTYEPPQPQRSATTMDAATQAQWDKWCDSRIERFLAKKVFTKAQGKTMVHVIVALRREFREALRAEISALRQDVTRSSAIARGEVKELLSKPDAA
jgi:hypothetical protein